MVWLVTLVPRYLTFKCGIPWIIGNIHYNRAHIPTIFHQSEVPYGKP